MIPGVANATVLINAVMTLFLSSCGRQEAVRKPHTDYLSLS
jgi:hypothetical protein